MAQRPVRNHLAHSLAIAGVLALVYLLASNAPAEAEGECSAVPILVKIHADWCSTCKALESVWTQLDTDMGDRITLVKLDVSDRIAYQESAATAKRLGLEDFFQEFRSRTGTIAVLDCNTLEPVAVMSGEKDLGKYRDAIAKASHSS